MYLTVNLVLFFLMQVGATLLFKWGSTSSRYYWWGFGFGNLIGAASMIQLINIYKVLNPNLTLTICSGGSFLLSQLALALVYRTRIGICSAVGVLLIVGGIVEMTLFL